MGARAISHIKGVANSRHAKGAKYIPRRRGRTSFGSKGLIVGHRKREDQVGNDPAHGHTHGHVGVGLGMYVLEGGKGGGFEILLSM
jgi:hypothetical protein